jgi:hypothetical protein
MKKILLGLICLSVFCLSGCGILSDDENGFLDYTEALLSHPDSFLPMQFGANDEIFNQVLRRFAYFKDDRESDFSKTILQNYVDQCTTSPQFSLDSFQYCNNNVLCDSLGIKSFEANMQKAYTAKCGALMMLNRGDLSSFFYQYSYGVDLYSQSLYMLLNRYAEVESAFGSVFQKVFVDQLFDFVESTSVNAREYIAICNDFIDKESDEFEFFCSTSSQRIFLSDFVDMIDEKGNGRIVFEKVILKRNSEFTKLLDSLVQEFALYIMSDSGQ